MFITIFGIYLTDFIFPFNYTFYEIILPWGIPIIKCNKFIWSKVWKHIHKYLTENRYLFMNTFVIEHCFPINRLNEFFNIFNICSIVVPNQMLIWRWIFNTEIKFDDGSLNVTKDEHHYQLLNLVGQWILNQFRRKFVVVDEWV